MSVMELLLRVFISFFVLFLMARIMGRKEISQMTFFNFVSAIAIGSISGSFVTSQNLSILNGVLALVGWGAITVILGIIDIKSKVARKVTTGQPIIVVKDGKIMENALRKARLDVDSLISLLRKNQVFSVSDVDFAIFETNGNLSVNLKHEKKPITREDMNMNSASNIYSNTIQVISDGKVLRKNLSKINLDQQWLDKQLEQQGIHNLSEVFYAEVQKDGSLYIDNKDDYIH
ncbi:YetF domain-containing protein [Oceanobacillus senegalensis]|uniref:YetF domain-containing protein n=1 Tax=Oceanobacillus senegalensis TaxID=1936063 RepID=UPI000A30A05E|nr:DUF421 domain-containing protein [Oceanobacillus senegalensis]